MSDAEKSEISYDFMILFLLIILVIIEVIYTFRLLFCSEPKEDVSCFKFGMSIDFIPTNSYGRYTFPPVHWRKEISYSEEPV